MYLLLISAAYHILRDLSSSSLLSLSTNMPASTNNSKTDIVSSSSSNIINNSDETQINSSTLNSSGLIIGWCTATGTAKRMALLTAADAADNDINVLSCCDVSEISLDTSATNKFFLLLFVSTQGDGDAPSTWDIFKPKFKDDYQHFASLCDENTAKSCVGYHVVALGDSSYRHYAKAGKVAASWLSELFSKSMVSPPEANTTLCDARVGAATVEEMIENKMESLLMNKTEGLKSKYPEFAASRNQSATSSTQNSSSSASQKVLSCSIKDPEMDRIPKSSPFPSPSSIQPPSSDRPVELKISHELTQKMSEEKEGAARTVYNVVFDSTPLTSRSPVQAGDHLGVYVSNSLSLAERCATALRIPKEKWNWTLVVHSTTKASNRASPKEALPASVTVIDALRYYPDLTGPPRKRFISKVRQRCGMSSCGEKQFNDLMTKKMNEKDGQYVTSVDILELGDRILCENNNNDNEEPIISLEDFFFLCPRLLPRFFSVSDIWNYNNNLESKSAVSSSSKRTLNTSKSSSEPTAVTIYLSLLVALLPHGCFSEMVERAIETKQQQQQERFFVFIRRTTFHPNLPSYSTFFTTQSSVCHKPIIMIGAGTGIAPFVGFCREVDDFLKGRTKGIPTNNNGNNSSSNGHSQIEISKKKKKRATHDSPKKKVEDIPSSSSMNNDEDGDLVAAVQTTSAFDEETKTQRQQLNIGLVYGFTTFKVGSPHLDFFRSLDYLTFFDEAESRPHLRKTEDVPSNNNNNNNDNNHQIIPPQRVQQKLSDTERAKVMANWIIDQGAYIYICGRSAMAKEVEEVIEKEILVKAGGMSHDAASRYMQHQLRNNLRLRLDCWES